MLLSLEEYEKALNGEKCFYCGGGIGKNGTGLDRLDCSKPYEVGNVVACCKPCNLVKNDSISKDEMLEIVKLLKKLRDKKDNIWS